MPGDPNLWESYYGAGTGYANMGMYYDVGDAGSVDMFGPDMHTNFVVWLAVFALAAVAILGGLKVGGFHFVVKS